jgi:hypothetical protein
VAGEPADGEGEGPRRLSAHARLHPLSPFRQGSEGGLATPNPRRSVETAAAPRPIGPYSQAVVSGDLVFCSGQVGIDLETGSVVAGGAAVECRRVMEGLGAVLAAAGCDFDDVVKATI